MDTSCLARCLIHPPAVECRAQRRVRPCCSAAALQQGRSAYSCARELEQGSALRSATVPLQREWIPLQRAPFTQRSSMLAVHPEPVALTRLVECARNGSALQMTQK